MHISCKHGDTGISGKPVAENIYAKYDDLNEETMEAEALAERILLGYREDERTKQT